MSRHVVDTNVPIAANGSNNEISIECRIKCIDFLEELSGRGILIVDLDGEVESEYRRHLSHGQPGVGNRFLQYFFSQAVTRLERVALEKKNGSYTDLNFDGPLKRFDLSDRKFAALSARTGAEVAIATDSDWLNFADELTKKGVRLNFLCGRQMAKWFQR